MPFGKAPSWFKKEQSKPTSSIEERRNDAAAEFRPEDKVGKGTDLSPDSLKKPEDYSTQEWVNAIGPSLGKTFEGQDENHEAVSTGTEETPLETRTRLESLVHKLGLQKNPQPEEVLEVSMSQVVPDIDIASTEAYARREERAQKFAEKYGITDTRTALLDAEREYTDAIRDLKAKTLKLPFSRVPDEVREKYDEASLAWRKALFAAVEMAPQREKHQATIISFRDTVMRAEEARQRGSLEAATLKDQKLFGKVLNWGQTGLSTAVKGYIQGTKIIGSLAARGHARSREYLSTEGISEAQLVERYTRATRIVSGALLGTLVMGSAGTAGVATTVLFKSVRGTLGLAVGSVTGVYSGKAYRKTAGAILRENTRDVKRSQKTDENDLDHERLAWRLGRGSAIEKQARIAQVLGAFLGGASTSLMSNVTFHEITELSSVQGAHETLTEHQQSVGTPHSAEHVVPLRDAEATPEPSVSVHEIPHTDTAPLVVSRGEGADKLISDLQDRLRLQYPDAATTPENVKALLRFGSHTTAQHLGLGHESGGVMLHPGDSLTVDDHGRLIFHDNIHDRNRILINEKHELHPLKRPSVTVHETEHHKSHETHTRIKSHKEEFDVAADRRAVAEANKAELAEEQHRALHNDSLAENTSPNGHPEELSPTEPIPEPEVTVAVPEAAVTEPIPNPVTAEQVRSPATAPEVSDHRPHISSPEDFERSISTNSHGIFIDEDVPHVYVTETQNMTVYGGNDTASRLIATEYAKSHPGTGVHFQVHGVDGLGNQITYAGEVSVDATGKVFVDIPDPKTEVVPPPPDPKTFIEVKP